ncbi:MAG: hypothetical protein GXP51_02745 [Deltaproteobacteria bacterium]|nr:hypothetical protein [Deltaproteobacteria bacterium]
MIKLKRADVYSISLLFPGGHRSATEQPSPFLPEARIGRRGAAQQMSITGKKQAAHLFDLCTTPSIYVIFELGTATAVNGQQ